jgi:hypothetical protein
MISMFCLNSTYLFAGQIVVPNDSDYIYIESKDFRLIFPPELLDEAEFTYGLSKNVKSDYDDSFGYQMDEKLNIGLLSKNNQVANGFSNQSPFNMQMNYIGGTELIDYFSSKSWLKLLIYHETAHNYQLNTKNNVFSKYAKKYLGNNEIPFFVTFIPLFTFPNLLLPQIITEGNATFNESWHNNGGRLYSGRARALLMARLKNNGIDPTMLINTTLEFPYSEEKYLIGGFFWLYLSEEYGIKKANSFFMENSKHFINPFRTNRVFKDTFGIDFYQAVAGFKKRFKNDAENFKELKGDIIATAKVYNQMNKVDNKILYFSRDLKNNPILHILDIDSMKTHSIQSNWLGGKPFIYDNTYSTATSYVDGPEKIIQGLFDKDGYLIKGTGSKMIQDINGTDLLYFNVEESFLKAALYYNNKFYDFTNSSAIFDKDSNIYYFKQKDKTRTLYKNKQPVFSYKGYYGFVTEVDEEGNIYFIAPTTYGSSLFKYDGKQVFRLSTADNILSAKLLKNGKILASTLNFNEYRYIIYEPELIKEEPYEITYFFEKDYKKDEVEEAKNLQTKEYSMFRNMRFSSLYPRFTIDSEKGIIFDLTANFADPLLYNQFSLFVARNNDKEYLGGAKYINTKYRLEYGLGFYGITKDDDEDDERNYGGDAFAQYSLYQKGFHNLYTRLRFYLDDEHEDKNPVTIKLDYSYLEAQPLRMYPNLKAEALTYGKYDRGDNFIGGDLDFLKGFKYDIFIGGHFKYIYSDTDKNEDARGIKITDDILDPANDVTTVEMPNLSDDFYAKEVLKATATIKKQFDFYKYFFTFPISLRREAVYLDYNFYQIKDFQDKNTDVNEFIVGLRFDLLILNRAPIPISVEYINNDKAEDREKYRLIFNLDF